MPRRLPLWLALAGAALFVATGLWLADRLPTWSEEVSLQSNHGYRVLPDEVTAPAAGPLPVLPWCGEPGGVHEHWIVSSVRPVLALCIAGRSLPVMTMSYASGVFAWPMLLAQPLHHDDVFVQRKIGLVRGLLALVLLYVMVRRLADDFAAGLSCLLAGASSPFVYPHVLLFPYETLPWTLVASAFWIWSRCPALVPGAERSETPPSWGKLVVGAVFLGLGILANVKAIFLFLPLLVLALTRGVRLRRISASQWITMAVIVALACSPTWIFALADPAAGLSQQFARRMDTIAFKLRPSAVLAEMVNLPTFGSDVGFYFEQVAGKPGTRFVVGIVAVAAPIAYALFCGIAHLVRRRVGSSLAAACGLILLTYFFVSLLLYKQVPAANYSPLHCVFGATYAAFCVDAGALVVRLARERGIRLPAVAAAGLLAAPLVAVLSYTTLRRGDPSHTMTTSINAAAERSAAHYLLQHPDARGELMTTSYNLAGVIDSLGEERIHPLQAHTLLERCRDGGADAVTACLTDRLRWILGHEGVLPLRVLAPEVVTLVDKPVAVHEAMPTALHLAAAASKLDLSVEATFATADGTEVLRLYRLAPARE